MRGLQPRVADRAGASRKFCADPHRHGSTFVDFKLDFADLLVTVEKKACFRLRLDSVLGQLVPSNGALPREPHRAHRGSARLLARVGPLVRFNVALLGEPGPHRASVRLLARVAQAPTSGATWLFEFWPSRRRGHIEQAYGFSPVWVRSCGATELFSLNRTG